MGGPRCMYTLSKVDDSRIGLLLKMLQVSTGLSVVLCGGKWSGCFLFSLISMVTDNEPECVGFKVPNNDEDETVLNSERDGVNTRVKIITYDEYVNKLGGVMSEAKRVYFFDPIPSLEFYLQILSGLPKSAISILMLFDHERPLVTAIDSYHPDSYNVKHTQVSQQGGLKHYQDVLHKAWQVTKRHFRTVNFAEHAYIEFVENYYKHPLKQYGLDFKKLSPETLCKSFLLKTPIRCEEFNTMKGSIRTSGGGPLHKDVVSQRQLVYHLRKYKCRDVTFDQLLQ
ncbi:hypothetical protein GNI_045830 [Gregarina niphandrodes]|uniref:Uncharacterized protein n=1 Tax=Gregarina niphandrodes TaxID=110365 RepID=A0A023B9Y3_GRENI|nr:hypothetical protein GNI_045830 [Gregarina niphandrodes]EZG75888.1 hypothetical protein GNI_045830 [Gregarina niphandrodes]|eukprot:XP_011129598.1 hypothetical protein GNI_045830 [Gregarina niphandrodes]